MKELRVDPQTESQDICSASTISPSGREWICVSNHRTNVRCGNLGPDNHYFVSKYLEEKGEPMSYRDMRSTGGNKFYDLPMTRDEFLIAVNNGVGDLIKWAEETNKVLDYSQISILTKPVGDGSRVSITVEADLQERNEV